MRDPHRHSFHLIVRHVNHSRLQALVQANQLGPRLHAQLGVQVGQWLVHQEHSGVAHDGPSDRHALPLPAGKRARLPLQQLADIQHVGGLGHPPLNLGLGRLAQLQAKRQVVVDAHVGIQGVALKHHGNVAVLGRHVIHQAVADVNVAASELLEPRDHAQRRGLAAARRPHEHEKFPILDLNRHVIDGDNIAKAFRDAVEHDASHQQAPRPADAAAPPRCQARTELFGKSRSLPHRSGADDPAHGTEARPPNRPARTLTNRTRFVNVDTAGQAGSVRLRNPRARRHPSSDQS